MFFNWCFWSSFQTGQEHELIESMPLLEWFANNYKKFGATLEIVTDKSQEGSQFVKGFGGIGGKNCLSSHILWYFTFIYSKYNYYPSAN